MIFFLIFVCFVSHLLLLQSKLLWCFVKIGCFTYPNELTVFDCGHFSVVQFRFKVFELAVSLFFVWSVFVLSVVCLLLNYVEIVYVLSLWKNSNCTRLYEKHAIIFNSVSLNFIYPFRFSRYEV